ncbi:MAG: M23 family metallopeptidase [Carnobacterium alterfunditum]
MENLLRAIFIAFIAVFGLVLNANLSSHAQTLHYFKEDLEVAVHDAALELNETELSRGNLVFDQEKARETLLESFGEISKLEPTSYELIDIVFIDDSNSVFPVRHNNGTVNFTDTFEEATIVAVVKGKSNAYFADDSNRDFIQIASYSYDPNAEPVVRTNSLKVQNVQILGVANENGFAWPSSVTQRTTSQFGMRLHPVYKDMRLHAGTDIADVGVHGTPVLSAKDGTVVYAAPLSTYGNLVMIDHGDGVQTRYAHLSGFNVSQGDKVAQGQVVGYVGNTGIGTGSHLHFEIRIDGIPYNPLNFYQ